VTSDHTSVRTSRSGVINSDQHDYHNRSFIHRTGIASQGTTREEFSQTDFQNNLEQEIVLGEYLETKLGPDFKQLKVKLSNNSKRNNLSEDSVANISVTRMNVPEIVIVEYDEEQII